VLPEFLFRHARQLALGQLQHKAFADHGKLLRKIAQQHFSFLLQPQPLLLDLTEFILDFARSSRCRPLPLKGMEEAPDRTVHVQRAKPGQQQREQQPCCIHRDNNLGR
jgi:hypothetical protein